MPGKYGFHQTIPDELIKDMGREWAENFAGQNFRCHLDNQNLHPVEGARGEIKIAWSAFPEKMDPPDRSLWQRLWDAIRRRPKPEPYVTWPIYGYVWLKEDASAEQ